MVFNRLGIALSSCVLLFSLLSAGWASAQVILNQDGMRSGQFIEPSRALRQVLRDAESAAGEKRWGDVVLSLGELLARPVGLDPEDSLGGEDFLLDADAENTSIYRQSARAEAEKILGAMPSEGIQIYRLRYGAEATRMLEQASQDRDWNLLNEISRRFLHTEAGYDATVLLAGRELSRGQPRAAAFLLERLHVHPAARQQLGAPLTEMLQTAWQLAGQAERAAALGAPVKASAKNPTSQWHSRRTHPGTIVNGGNPARSGEHGADLPIRHAKWKANLATNPQEAATLDGHQQQRRGGEASSVPSWHPLVAGSYVLARTTERLGGFHREQGNLIWTHPFGDIQPGFESEAAQHLGGLAEMGGIDLLEQRAWKDLPYGRVTSDGKRVFLLDDLSPIERAMIGGFGAVPGMRQGMRPRDAETSSLIAVDLETEGKLLWAIDGSETTEPGLLNAFFLGAPLPYEGYLYGIIDIGGDTYLICLDAAEGNLVWRQHLATSDTGVQTNPALRRMVGAVPSISDGVIVCPTGQGAVVAMDLATRSLRWAISRPATLSGAYSNQVFQQRGGEGMLEGARWLDGDVVIADGCALVPMPESDELICVDLVTGDLRWPKMARDSWCFIAGVHGGAFLLASDSAIMAFDLRTGAKAWGQLATMPSGERISGRTVFTSDSVLVPTSANKIHRVNLETGEITGTISTDYPAGNLTVSAGSIFSQGVNELGAAYLGGKSLEQSIATRLALNPNDVWALLRQSESLLESGQIREAIERLQQARKVAPDDEEVRVLLVEGMLNLVKRDLTSISEYRDELQRLAVLAEERVELLRVLIEGAIQGDRRQEAIERLVDLSKLASQHSARGLQALGERITVGDRDVAVDDWIGARVGDLTRGRSPQEIEVLEKPVVTYLASIGNPNVPLKERILRQFGALESGNAMRLALAKEWLADGEYLKSERLLLEAMDRAAPGASRPWQLLLARLYSDVGWVADARDALAQGESQGGPATVEELAGMTRDDLEESWAKQESPRYWEPWPQYFRRIENNQEGLATSTDQHAVPTAGRRARQWDGWQLTDGAPGELRIIDPLGHMQLMLNIGGGNRQRFRAIECHFDGGLLLIALPDELVAVDLFDVFESGQILWRRPIMGDGSPTLNPPREEAKLVGRDEHVLVDGNQAPLVRIAQPLGKRACVFAAGRVTCINLLDGNEIWSFPVSGPEFAGISLSRIYPTAYDGGFTLLASFASKRWVLDPFDGAIVDRPEWDQSDAILDVYGNHALVARQRDVANEAEGAAIKMLDLITGKPILESKTSFWTDIENRLHCFLHTDGSLRIWDLRTGQSIADDRLEHDQPFTGINATQRGERLLVAGLSRSEESKTWRTLDQEWFGAIASYSLSDGKRQWLTKLTDPYGCRLEQPPGWPLLILAREVPSDSPNIKHQFEVRALDTRTGTLEERGHVSTSSRTPSSPTVTVESPQEQGSVKLGKLSLRYTFQASPPGPNDSEAQGTGPANEDPFGLFNPFDERDPAK